MKKISVQLLTLSIATIFAMNACRNKEDAEPNISDSDMKVNSAQVSDNDNVTSSVDDVLDKVNSDIAGTNGNARLEETTCGFTVNRSNYNATLSGISQKTIVYTFNNQLCDGRTRTGTVTATLVSGNYFKDEGAVYNLVFDGYAVTAKGETATLTGTQTVTNVSGGLPRFLITRPNEFSSVTHKITGNMQLKFSDAIGTRNWSIDREITWANSNGVLSYTLSSNRTVDGYSNVSSTGTNRLGYTFYTQIVSPITANSSCGWYRPTGGERKHTLVDTDGSTVFTSQAVINVGTDGCGTGFTLTTTNKRGKVRTITVTY